LGLVFAVARHALADMGGYRRRLCGVPNSINSFAQRGGSEERMKVKRNTEKAIVMAMNEIYEAGIPVKEFDPEQRPGEHFGFDWVFERDITPQEVERVKAITAKWFDVNWG
jgi:hypothetical protein